MNIYYEKVPISNGCEFYCLLLKYMYREHRLILVLIIDFWSFQALSLKTFIVDYYVLCNTEKKDNLLSNQIKRISFK